MNPEIEDKVLMFALDKYQDISDYEDVRSNLDYLSIKDIVLLQYYSNEMYSNGKLLVRLHSNLSSVFDGIIIDGLNELF